MFYLLSFILGASVGSFTQVIATRLHVAPITKGRSKCLSCGEALRVLDLIPILSYLMLKGRCRYCKTSYGPLAILIESLYGISFVLLYHYVLKGQEGMLASLSWLLYYSALFVTLGVMALYDKAHSYIPVRFLAAFLLLTMGMYVMRIVSYDNSLTSVLSPILVALPFLSIWILTRGRGVGFGDVILFFGVGAFFPFYQGLAVFMLSVWGGAVVGIYLKYIKKSHLDGGSAVPFVPFIVLAFLVVLFTGVDLLSIAILFG